jgi:hypothetical protein
MSFILSYPTSTGNTSEHNAWPPNLREQAVAAFASYERGKRLFDWVTEGSWSTCESCGSHQMEALVINSAGPVKTPASTCKQCTSRDRAYMTPRLADYPETVRGLTEKEQHLLAPLLLVFDKFERCGRYGYNKSVGAPRVIGKRHVFKERLARSGLSPARKSRLELAFEDLYQNCTSFRQFEEAIESEPQKFYSLTFGCLECGIYPALYPRDSFSDLGNRESLTRADDRARRSSKRSFQRKMYSSVGDYRRNERLVLLHFYAHLRALVSSAVAQKITTPSNYLAEKDISSTYYLRKMLCLKDVCRQHGLPHLMVTLSPCDSPGGLPLPSWLDTEFTTSGASVRIKGAPVSNVHFAHVIHELARVLFAGVSAHGRQQKHHLLYAPTQERDGNNVKTFFTRLETQRRGTIHGHILFWLNNFDDTLLASLTTTELFREHPLLSSWISRIQASSKRTQDGERRIRAYVQELLCGLRSHIDVTAGRGTSLSYVCTYSSKASDALVGASELNARATADPSRTQGEISAILASVEIGVPETALHLSEVSSTHLWGSQLNVPVASDLEGLQKHRWVLAYIARQDEWADLTALEYLRLLKQDFSGPRSRGHPRVVAVGYSLLPHSNHRHYLQYAALHGRYQSLAELKGDELVSIELRYVKMCIEKLPEHFEEPGFSDRLRREGNTEDYILAACAATRCYKRLLENRGTSKLTVTTNSKLPPLNVEQSSVLTSILAYFGTSDQQKPVVLLGRAGTGKTRLLFELLLRFLGDDSARALFACPTGKLASDVAQRLTSAGLSKRVDVDTCHRSFGLMLSEGVYAKRVRDLTTYALVVVDEVSMISAENAKRIVLLARSYGFKLLFGGDLRQLPPPNVLPRLRVARCSEFWSSCHPRLHLSQQVRVEDVELQNFLDVIRVRPPSFEELRAFVEPVVWNSYFYLRGEVSDELIKEAFADHPQGSWLCATNAGVSRVNRLRSKIFISDFVLRNPRGVAVSTVLDGLLEPVDLAPGMPIMVLENVSLDEGLVNGEILHLKFVDGHALSLENQLGEDRVLSASFCDLEGRRVAYFPIRVAFAMTVHKSQGITLPWATLWFDTESSSILEGLAYVAFSRVRRREHLRVFGTLRTSHFVPCVI